MKKPRLPYTEDGVFTMIGDKKLSFLENMWGRSYEI